MAKIKGIEALIKKLQTLKGDAEVAVRKGLLTSAEEMAASARAKAPRDQGVLIASIGATATNRGAKVQATALHAPFIEFGTGGFTVAPIGYENYPKEFFVNGTGKTKPQPFLFPAVFENEAGIKENIEAELKKVLDTYK